MGDQLIANVELKLYQNNNFFDLLHQLIMLYLQTNLSQLFVWMMSVLWRIWSLIMKSWSDHLVLAGRFWASGFDQEPHRGSKWVRSSLQLLYSVRISVRKNGRKIYHKLKQAFFFDLCQIFLGASESSRTSNVWDIANLECRKRIFFWNNYCNECLF